MRNFIARFLRTEAGGGALLAVTALLGLAMANSPFASAYFESLKYPIALDAGFWRVEMSLKEWVKDGLMALFFFVIGLELKRELTIGELSNLRTIALPVAAACGGALVPTLIYLAIAGNADPRGWPVPVATDIAFALAALSLLAPKTDVRLRIFLLTLAVVDDLIAIVLIALLFTSDLALAPLLIALALLAGVFVLQRWLELPRGVYWALALITWALAIESGVHSSVMAVAAAFVVPIKGVRSGREILENLEHRGHDASAFIVLPVFAFAAAGVSFQGLDLSALTSPASAGVALGLALGKPIGVIGAAGLAMLALRANGSIPFADIVRAGFLCGIGFTMSLFIGSLAYADDPDGETLMRIGVLSGSLLSLAFSVIAFALGRRAEFRMAS